MLYKLYMGSASPSATSHAYARRHRPETPGSPIASQSAQTGPARWWPRRDEECRAARNVCATHRHAGRHVLGLALAVPSLAQGVCRVIAPTRNAIRRCWCQPSEQPRTSMSTEQVRVADVNRQTRFGKMALDAATAALRHLMLGERGEEACRRPAFLVGL